MKKIPVLILTLLAFTHPAWSQVEALIRKLHDPADTTVLVVAHRSDWRSAPENSLQAMRNAIALGVDIIETDVRRTKDGVLIIMHDESIDRTTTGKGLVADHTLAELRALTLRDGIGSPTAHPIPTLEEAMLTVKGRALINLDKCYPYFAEAMAVLEKTGTVDHAIFKSDLPYALVKAENGRFLDRVAFMPVIQFDRPGAAAILEEYLRELKPVAFELIFSAGRPPVMQALADIRHHHARIWINALWPPQNADHADERAVTDPDATYGWLVAQGASIIQTDRPALLLNFLRQRDRH